MCKETYKDSTNRKENTYATTRRVVVSMSNNGASSKKIKNLHSFSLPQLDGLSDTISKHSPTGINSEIGWITNLVNIFRSFDWKTFESHPLCAESGGCCILCRIRSIALRANNAKNRRLLIPVELLSILDQLTGNISCQSKVNERCSQRNVLN